MHANLDGFFFENNCVKKGLEFKRRIIFIENPLLKEKKLELKQVDYTFH